MCTKKKLLKEHELLSSMTKLGNGTDPALKLTTTANLIPPRQTMIKSYSQPTDSQNVQVSHT